MEDLLRKLPGVIDTEVGYAGGTNESPTYQNHSGHAEALQITYNQEITSFTKLLDTFFQLHDPTTHNRQGNDIGLSYRSAIFYNNEMEKEEAKQMIEIVNSSGR